MSTGREHKFKVIEGVLPKKAEIVDWSSEKIMALLQLADFFTLSNKFNVNKETIGTFQSRALEEAFWMEFNVRIGHQLDRADFSKQKFNMRLIAMVRTVLGWLKSNPHAITNEMRELMEPNERLNWALDPFKMKTTAIGAEIVAIDNRETTDPNMANATASTNLTVPEIQYHQGLLHMSSIFKQITGGLTANDFKKMSVSERLKIANSIAQTLGRAFNTKVPSTVIFKKLTVNSAGRDDLEKAMLQYSQEQ